MMGNLCKRERKSSRKELTIETLKEEKENVRQTPYNYRHSTSHITIGPTTPV